MFFLVGALGDRGSLPIRLSHTAREGRLDAQIERDLPDAPIMISVQRLNKRRGTDTMRDAGRILLHIIRDCGCTVVVGRKYSFCYGLINYVFHAALP